MLPTLNPQSIAGKIVLLRCDFNVSIHNGTVGDRSRILASIPTIQFLLNHDAIVVLASHLGRPKGTVVEALRLAPIHQVLEEELDRSIYYDGTTITPLIKKVIAHSKPGSIILLENIQFHPGECNNDPHYAQELASLAEVYVNDAFGQAHRSYASLVGITQHLPSYAGFLLEKEINALEDFMDNVQAPGCIVMGGVKMETKVPVIQHLLPYAQQFLFGGGIANSLLLAQGNNIGSSLAETDTEKQAQAQHILHTITQAGATYSLPQDVVVELVDRSTAIVEHTAVTQGMRILDIGPRTIAHYRQQIMEAHTVIWNGPMGYLEDPEYTNGTREILQAIADTQAATLIGGGDTLEALRQFHIDHTHFTHVSTGGGAMLRFLEGQSLPAITALQKNTT